MRGCALRVNNQPHRSITKKRQNNCTGASALQIAFPIALLFATAILFAAASGQSVRAAVSESSAVSKRASGGNDLASFYPKRYGEPFVVEGEGVRGSWVPTGSVGTARGLHTATLLPSGKVLVAGGSNSGALSSAELYDPATGSWSSTGSLGTARAGHTATLLPSGQVLVAGGYGDGLRLSSAELYDPATGSWSSTGSLGDSTLPTHGDAAALRAGAGGGGSRFQWSLDQRGAL